MTRNKQPNDIAAHRIRIVKRVLYVSGFVFLALGVWNLTATNLFDLWFGLDRKTSSVMSYALILVGMIDIFVVPKILDKANTKRKL